MLSGKVEEMGAVKKYQGNKQQVDLLLSLRNSVLPHVKPAATAASPPRLSVFPILPACLLIILPQSPGVGYGIGTPLFL